MFCIRPRFRNKSSWLVLLLLVDSMGNKFFFRFSLVSKLEIVDIHQIDSNAVKLLWKINETIENYLSSIQIQYRLMYPKTSWMKSEEFYNRSVNQATIQNLQQNQIYKFRLIGFDVNGKQLVISATKRFTLDFLKKQPNVPVPQITDAWITNDDQISLKWQVSNTLD